jgi:competence protein ComFC
MRCLLCESWSPAHICKRCRSVQLVPSFYTRKITGKLSVHSFYKYDEIEPLLLTKHTDLGYYIYKTLGKIAFGAYAKTLTYESPVAVIGIDDHIRHGYAHTALLARAMKRTNLTPRFTALRDRSGHHYSGKDFQYRLTHPREFVLKPFPEKQVILVDDILTTGLTLTQAAEALQTAGKELLFCLTLADAQKRT